MTEGVDTTAGEPRRARSIVGDLSRRNARLGMGLLLLAALALFATGIDWGMPDWHGWTGDELHPASWERAVTPETHAGWHARYPALHFTVLHNLSRPLRWAMKEGGPLERDPWRQNVTLTLAARWLSVLMALATLVVVYFLGRRIAGQRGGRRTGLLAAATLTLVAPYVYYAKMANLESPYLLWVALTFLFLLRLVEPGGVGRPGPGPDAPKGEGDVYGGGEPFGPPRVLDAVLFGLAAGAAVATKDQAYALFALMPLPVVVALARHQRGAGRGARLARALVDRRFLTAGASAALSYVVLQSMLTNWVRFSHHVELLLGPMSGPYRDFGHGPWDQLLLAYRFLLQLAFSMNPFLFLAAVGGVVWVAVRARRARQGGGRPGETEILAASGDGGAPAPLHPDVREAWLLGTLLLVALSYYLTLIAVIGFTFDRYVLPVVLVLALAAGRFFSLLLAVTATGPSRPRGVLRVALAAGFVFAALYASSVNTRLLVDSRYGVEELVAERAGAAPARDPGLAIAIGRTKHVPRFHRLSWSQALRNDGRALERFQPRFIAVNLTDIRHPHERAFVERLDSRELGYLRVLTHRGDPAWNLLYLGDRFGAISTSQRFINPEIALWERLPGGRRGAQPSSGAGGEAGEEAGGEAAAGEEEDADSSGSGGSR